jgi:hypothetical protein
MIESSGFFLSEILGLISWGIMEIEKYLTVFSLGSFKNTPKKLCLFVDKKFHFFLRNAILEKQN